MDSFLIQLTLLTGVPIDQIKMLTGFFISVTFGFAFKNFQSKLFFRSNLRSTIKINIWSYRRSIINHFCL